jgi:hypothetical protein
VLASQLAAHAELLATVTTGPNGVPIRVWSVSICSGMLSANDALAAVSPSFRSARVKATAGRADADMLAATRDEYAYTVMFNPGAAADNDLSAGANREMGWAPLYVIVSTPPTPLASAAPCGCVWSSRDVHPPLPQSRAARKASSNSAIFAALREPTADVDNETERLVAQYLDVAIGSHPAGLWFMMVHSENEPSPRSSTVPQLHAVIARVVVSNSSPNPLQPEWTIKC